MNGIERRYFIGDKCRAAITEGEDGLNLGGLGVVYNQWSDDLGGFIEMNQIDAAKEVIGTDDIRGLFDHESSRPLGRSKGPTPTMKLTNSADGVRYDIKLGKSTIATDVHDFVDRGDVTGSSYMFRLGKTFEEIEANIEVTWDEDIQLYRRVVKLIPMMFDIGPVTFPAYPDSTSEARSWLKEFEKRNGIGAVSSADEKAAAIRMQIQRETEQNDLFKRRLKS